LTDGQQLTAFFVDECRRQGKTQMLPLKGQVARIGKELLEDCELEAIKPAISELIRQERTHALCLGEIMLEQWREANETDPAKQPEARRRAQAWIDTNGWPTGVGLRRGTHSFQQVQDTLGTERPPSDWPYRKPTFDEVARALAAASARIQ
jgi:hypothetical protein